MEKYININKIEVISVTIFIVNYTAFSMLFLIVRALVPTILNIPF